MNQQNNKSLNNTFTKLPADPFAHARVWKIYAGAGSGKTKTISDTIEYLIEHKQVKPEEIVYVLFNRRPAEAFKNIWRAKGLTLEQMKWWGTHHSIAKRLLGLNQSNIITDIEKWGEEKGFDMHNDPFATDGGIDPYGWDATYASLQKKIFELTPGLDRDEARLLEALKKSEDEEKLFCHVRYLEKAIRMRLLPGEVRYVFADEAQDNSPLQHEWFKQIVENESIEGFMLAGDDKQAINKFRGAAPELFLNFKADAEVALPATWRCSENVLREANGVIKPVRKRSNLTTISMRKGRGLVETITLFSDALEEAKKYLRDKKSVMILARNRCFVQKAERALADAGVLVESDWVKRLKVTTNGLITIRRSGVITEESLAAILPGKKTERGQFKKDAYWEKGIVEKLRTGEGIMDDPDLFEAYGEIRLGGSIPLRDAERLGFKRDFINHMALWKIPDEKWFVPGDRLMAFKTAVYNFGWDFPMIRLDTIHSAKGEESDVVILLTDITESVATAEWNDEESERRIWYVGETRARDVLILTSLDLKNNSIIV